MPDYQLTMSPQVKAMLGELSKHFRCSQAEVVRELIEAAYRVHCPNGDLVVTPRKYYSDRRTRPR